MDNLFDMVGNGFSSLTDPKIGTPMAPNVALPSGGQSKVTSMFVPQSLLDMLPRDQAEEVSNRALWSFIGGALTGDLGSAYNNAANSGYNYINNLVNLQTHKNALDLKNADQALVSKYVIPGQGQLGDPNYQPPRFDYEGYMNDPSLPKYLTAEQRLTQLGPKPMVVGNRLIDSRDRKNINKYYPDVDKGMTVVEGPNGPTVQMIPGYRETKNAVTADEQAIKQEYNLPQGMTMAYDRNGKPIGVVNQNGFLQALGAQEGVKEKAKADYTRDEVTDTATGRKYTQPLSKSLYPGQAAPGAPAAGGASGGFVSELSPGEIVNQQESAKDFSALKTQIADKAAAVPSRITNAKVLAGLSQQFETGNLAPIAGQLANWGTAFGITGDKAKALASNVETFNTLRQEKLRQDVSLFKGSQSDRELGVLQNMGQSLKKPGDVNRFYSAFEIAQANRDQQIANALSQYNGPPDRASVQKFISEQPFMRQSLFTDPSFRNLTIGGQPVVKEMEHKGKKYLVVPMTKDVIPVN